MPVRFFILFFLVLTGNVFASEPVVFRDSSKLMQIGHALDLYRDSTNLLTIDQIRKQHFQPTGQTVPNLQISPFSNWARLFIKNETDLPRLLLEVEYPTIDEITLYEVLPSGGYRVVSLGQFQPYNLRPYDHQNYIFPLD
ncbi:MAG: 7TMR-DISMED2 domain-containing protein, partial [Chitinophaga sp.]